MKEVIERIIMWAATLLCVAVLCFVVAAPIIIVHMAASAIGPVPWIRWVVGAAVLTITFGIIVRGYWWQWNSPPAIVRRDRERREREAQGAGGRRLRERS